MPGQSRLHLVVRWAVIAVFTAGCAVASPARTPTATSTPGPTARPPADTITLQAPAHVSPGQEFTVSWTGREQLGDGIYVVEVGRTRIFPTDGDGYNTSLGNPGTLVAPTKPGAYEIWFLEEETVDHVKARLPLTVG